MKLSIKLLCLASLMAVACAASVTTWPADRLYVPGTPCVNAVLKFHTSLCQNLIYTHSEIPPVYDIIPTDKPLGKNEKPLKDIKQMLRVRVDVAAMCCRQPCSMSDLLNYC